MKHIINMAGERIGQLTVIKRDGWIGGNIAWLVHCDCGNTKRIRGSDLRTGRVKACGCLRVKHRMSNTLEYNSWKGMLQRCRDKNCADWQRYGKKGIKVCQGWHSFKNFYHDLGDRPAPNYSIDRIDNDGHYSCGHCDECLENHWIANGRWANEKQQKRNTSRNRMITYNGETRCLAEWAEYAGMSSALLRWRLGVGWGIKCAITTPVRPTRERQRK